MKVFKFIIRDNDQRQIPGTDNWLDGCGAVVLADTKAIAKNTLVRYCGEMGYDPRWLDVCDVAEYELQDFPQTIMFSGPLRGMIPPSRK